MHAATPPFTQHFSTLAPDYDVALCDVWGVVHNGVKASAEACDALMRFRAAIEPLASTTNSTRLPSRPSRTGSRMSS